MDTDDQFAATLSYLQCVLLARRQQIDTKPLNLKWIDIDILNALLINDTLQPSQLSQLLAVTRSTISKRLVYLEKHHLVKFQKGLDDGRTRYICITAVGESIMKSVFDSHQVIANQAAKILSKEERIQFESLARKLASQLDDSSLRMI